MFNEFVLLTTFYFNHNTIWNILAYLYCLDVYSGTIEVEAVEMWFSQQVLLMTIFIVEIIDGIFIDHLKDIQSSKYLLWGMAGESDTANV